MRLRTQAAIQLRDRALEASASGVTICDLTLPDVPVIYANKAFTKITGYSVDEILGRNCRILQGNEGDQSGLLVVREALKQRKACEVLLRNYRKDGSLFWNQLSLSPVPDPFTGEVTHYVGIQTDVTEQKNSENLLLEWITRLDVISTLSPDAFVCFDERSRLNYMNPAAERLLGSPFGDLNGITLLDFDGRMRDLCNSSFPYPSLGRINHDERDYDNRQTVLHINKPNSRVLQRTHRKCPSMGATLVLYFRDITREAEVDRMKSEFLSTAAHELRTPMTSIVGFSELMLTRKYNEQRSHELLKTINRQATQLTTLLSELLDLARIEARKQATCNFEHASLEGPIKEVVHGFIMPGDARRVQLSPSSVWPVIEVDKSKFQQALLNIISNAYKYSPNKEPIVLDTLIRHTAKQDEFGVRITDHGIGMTPEQMKLAFDRFYRVNASGEIPGTGLGLSLVKEIMRIHNGSVELESNFGVGTRVTLWFPILLTEETSF